MCSIQLLIIRARRPRIGQVLDAVSYHDMSELIAALESAGSTCIDSCKLAMIKYRRPRIGRGFDGLADSDLCELLDAVSTISQVRGIEIAEAGRISRP